MAISSQDVIRSLKSQVEGIDPKVMTEIATLAEAIAIMKETNPTASAIALEGSVLNCTVYFEN